MKNPCLVLLGALAVGMAACSESKDETGKQEIPGEQKSRQLPAPRPETDIRVETDIAPTEPRQKPRDEYLAAQAAVTGTAYPELRIKNEAFTAVTLREIDDEGVKIAHSRGEQRIKWRDVPPDLKNQWGYDPERAAEKIAEIAAESPGEMSEREVEGRTVAARIAELEYKINVAADELRAIESDSPGARGERMTALEKEIQDGRAEVLELKGQR